MIRNTHAIQNLLKNAMREHSLAGLAIAISHDGHELFAGGFGHADANRCRSVTADTIFGAASLTKFLTAVLVIYAAEKGQLNLSDPLSKHYPALNCAADPSICLHNLLNHSAGFPGLSSRFVAADTENNAENTGGVDGQRSTTTARTWGTGKRLSSAGDLVEFLNNVEFEMLGSPGSMLSYSNEGFCLLGGILEAIRSRPFNEIAHKDIFEPLGMEHSSIGAIDLIRRNDNVAVPLRMSASAFKSLKHWEAPLFYPAGGLMTSVRDLIVLFDLLEGKADFFLPHQAMQMTSGTMAVPSRPSGEFGYGYGLEIRQVDEKRTLAWHTGQRAGISSFAGRILEDRLTVALLANISDAPLASIAHSVLGTLLGLPELCWPPGRERQLPWESDLTLLTGQYGSQEGFVNRVSIQDNRLLLRAGGEEEEFFFSGPDFGTVGQQTFRFLDLQQAQSGPNALALDLRIFPKLTQGQSSMM